MKKSTLSIALAVIVSSTSVWAEAPQIAGGKEGGQYARYAANIAAALKDYKEFRGENAPVVLPPTGGSGENLDLLNEGKASVAPVQADAFMYYVKKHPEAAANLEILGELPKEECLFLVGRNDSKLTDLEKKSTRVAIGNPDSGQNISWNYISQLHKEFANATTYEKDGLRTLNKVVSGGDFGLDHYFFTFSKDINNDIIQTVNIEDKGLKFLDLNNGDLNEKLPNGKQVYEFKDALVKYEGWNRTVEVPCTKTLLLINTDIDDKMADRLAGLVAKGMNRIVGESDDSNKIK